MKRVNIIFLVLLLLISGCAKHKDEKTAEQLATEGMTYFDDKSYTNAIKSYEKIRDWYPFSKYAKEAELKIADSHYHLEEYEEAILAYTEFERLHPSDEKAPYVIYQIGRCHFDRIETIDRDATATRNSLKAFRRLQAQFPDNEYSRKAAPHIEVCMKNLAAKEMDIGLFYFKAEKYKAAMYRFVSVVTIYPGFGFDLKAQDYIAKCKELMAKGSEPPSHFAFFKKFWRSLMTRESEPPPPQVKIPESDSRAKDTEPDPDPYTAD